MNPTLPSPPRPGSIRTLLAFLILAVAGLCLTTHPEPLRLRILCWNIHHGEGLDGRVDLERIAALISAQNPDLVALQEVDKGVARTDRRDLPAELAQLTGMTCVFSNNYAFQGGEYGNATLSRLPIRSTTNTHLRMLRPGEQRGVLQVSVDWHGHPLFFFNTHIDHRPDDAERLANIAEFHQLTRTLDTRLVLFAGDFNDLPDSRTHRAMAERFTDVWAAVGDGHGLTFSSDQPRRRIDYIWLLHDSPLKPVRAWIVPSLASDHLPLLADFELETRP